MSFFFFQAEDGIRDYKVTGVQTCALPIWTGRSVVIADLVHAERRRAYERSDVDGATSVDEVLEALAERCPRDLVFDVRLAFDVVLAHLIGQRPHRRALPEYLAGHALPAVALCTAVRDQGGDRPGQHVDEARRDREACRLYLAAAPVADAGHHRADPIVIDRHIRGVRRPALALVHGPAAYDDVMHRAAI